LYVTVRCRVPRCVAQVCERGQRANLGSIPKPLSITIRSARSLAKAMQPCCRAQSREARSSLRAMPCWRRSGETNSPSMYPVFLPSNSGRSLRTESSAKPKMSPDRVSATRTAQRSLKTWPPKNAAISGPWSSALSVHNSRRIDSQAAASAGVAVRMTTSRPSSFMVHTFNADMALSLFGQAAAASG